MDLSVERLEGRIERLQSDALHAFDPAYRPREPLVGSRPGQPSPQANLQAPLPCEAPPGVFLVFDEGDGRRRYAAGAELALRGEAICDDEGRPLLGYPAGAPPGALRELRIDRRDALLGRAVALRIDGDGRIAYARRLTDGSGATSVQWVSAGRLALARLDGGVAHMAAPGEEGLPTLPGVRVQGGRVDLVHALERLQEAYLQLDALRAVRTAQDAGDRTALGTVK